jgi:hypothetical protein
MYRTRRREGAKDAVDFFASSRLRAFACAIMCNQRKELILPEHEYTRLRPDLHQDAR